MVDILTETTIDRPLALVAAFAAEPDNAPKWYWNIQEVAWVTEPGLRVGARIGFVAQFLGRRLVYTYEVVAFEPGALLTMRTTDGPFPMETTYTWSAVGSHRTHMSLRNRGQPTGFGRIAEPVMGAAMRRANTRDLYALKTLLEAAPRDAVG